VTIGAYMKRRHQFEFVLVDEAHNLRSAIELDRNIVKSIHLEKGDPIFNHVVSTLEKDTSYTAKELSIETAHDILKNMKGSEHETDVRQVLGTLSQWRSFCIVSDTTCDLKFIAADPEKRTLMPKGRLFLFSATPLDGEELHFYCNVPKETIQTVGRRQIDFVPKENVIYCNTLCKSDSEKMGFVISLLKDSKLPTLILVNSNLMCLKWSHELLSELGARVNTIQSGLHYTKRLRIYKEFTSHPDRILVTSSSVYWEGITIRNLRLLIIPSPPFPQSNLLEIAQRKYVQYAKITKRRLIQGMGRIGRSPLEKGICLLLFRADILDGYVKTITKEKIGYLIAALTKSSALSRS
jgi:superfamily II DNA/RNA helicase